jgi:hypothetical protein
MDLGSIAAAEAESIEAADSAHDAGLRGDNVLDVSLTCDLDGTIKAVEVSYNARNAHITVNVTDGTLTASAGFDSHRTHINGDADMVLSDAEAWWQTHAEGVSMR